MSFTIRIDNTGHVFVAEGRLSVLRAGLNAGLNLEHNCANGSCGRCKARLLDGQLVAAQHHDYCLSEQEKTDGVFLMCCQRPGSDLVIATRESDAPADIPEQRVKARVVRLDHVQDSVLQLTLRTPRSKGLQFLAGQSVELHVEGVGSRELPIASCPCDAILLRFHLRRQEQDAFGEFVFDKLQKGREVVLTGPRGGFTLDEQSQRPLLFVAWETGFAPVASLIEHAIQQNPERLIHLYWLSALQRGHYLLNQCHAWEDALEQFYCHPVALEPVGEQRIESVFRRIARRHVPLADWDLYLALPETSVTATVEALQRNAVPEAQIRITTLQRP